MVEHIQKTRFVMTLTYLTLKMDCLDFSDLKQVDAAVEQTKLIRIGMYRRGVISRW